MGREGQVVTGPTLLGAAIPGPAVEAGALVTLLTR